MLTVERLHELFECDSNTGILYWKRHRQLIRIGSKAGTKWKDKSGKRYMVVSVDGRRQYVHRLVWFMCCGHISEAMSIDHIDGNGLNNSITNLRCVSHRANSLNQRKPSNNTSGFVGVIFDKRAGKWRAQIRIHGKFIYLGYFNLIEDAVTARKSAEEKYGFHSNHGSERPL